MILIKSFICAFSTFSKIPMPDINYKKEDARLMLLFFPFVGLFIGLIEYIWLEVSNYFAIESFGLIIGQLIIPIAITGGIHLDGFMDCMDAFSSYQDSPQKLEILKDPHIGAFSVIRMVELIGISLICLSNMNKELYILAFAGFMVSRILSAICIITFPQAKDTGMVAYTKSQASGYCLGGLFAELAIVLALLVLNFGLSTIFPVLASVITLALYRKNAIKSFGGITGDTAGCFLVMEELAWIGSLAIYSLVYKL